jgi:hypothetical protein
MNTNWPRWIYASVANHFDTSLTDYAVYVEGQHRDASSAPVLLEVRMDGPRFNETTKGIWEVYCELNILVQVTLDTVDAYKIHRVVGDVVALITDIELYKYGAGTLDNQTKFGCLQLLQDSKKRHVIEVNHFGRIEPNTELMQATVEAHYTTILEE